MQYIDNIAAIVEKAVVELKSTNSLTMLDNTKQNFIGTNGILPRSLKSALSLPKHIQKERLAAIEQAIDKVNAVYMQRVKLLKMIK